MDGVQKQLSSDEVHPFESLKSLSVHRIGMEGDLVKSLLKDEDAVRGNLTVDDGVYMRTVESTAVEDVTGDRTFVTEFIELQLRILLEVKGTVAVAAAMSSELSALSGFSSKQVSFFTIDITSPVEYSRRTCESNKNHQSSRVFIKKIKVIIY